MCWLYATLLAWHIHGSPEPLVETDFSDTVGDVRALNLAVVYESRR